MKFFLPFLTLMIFTSCSLDDKCNENFKSECLGVFGIDTLRLSVSDKNIVQKYKWDTVKLISDTTGRYYFNSEDTILKKSEGRWNVARYKIDGRCVIDIKQNDLSLNTGGEPFAITISPNNLPGMLIYFTRRINEPRGHK
jgi:hypothetical protein